MKRIVFFLFLLSIFLNSGPLIKAEENDLFFTYIGPTVSTGSNWISYKGWSSGSNTRTSKTISGYFLSAGGIFDIFVKNFIGEFTFEYINNFGGKDTASVQNLLFGATGKYSYSLNSFTNLTAGLGLYLETPPSSKSYDGGGGINSAIGAIFDLTREWKIVFDILFRYGHFGLGDDSSKLSLGAKAGMVYKIGRI